MTQEEIIELARQAGFDIKELGGETLIRTVHSKGYFVVINNKIEVFAKLVAEKERKAFIDHIDELQELVKLIRLDERESCAKIGDYFHDENANCGDLIRARGQA